MKMQRVKGLITSALVVSLVVGSTTVAMAKVSQETIPVSYNNIKIVVDSKELQTSREPFIYEGTTYLPVRAVAEAVGKEVAWDSATQTVTLSGGGTAAENANQTATTGKVGQENIQVSYNNIKIVVDGKELQTSREPFIYEGTTYLPVRAVAEAVGKEVAWDGATQTVTLSGSGAADKTQNADSRVASVITNDMRGEIGGLYRTQWFDLSVNSMEVVKEYGGQTADAGYRFVVLEVYEKNTWDGEETIPMGTFDFYVDHASFIDYIWPESPWTANMMPDEFDLAPGEEVTYMVVFVVPEGLTDADFIYIEIDEAEGVGSTFAINLALK